MKNNCQKNKNSGFTLMELLVTITVIGVLSSFVVVASVGQTAKARDSQRKSDLGQYRIAIENYAVKSKGLYPSLTPVTTNATTTLCTVLGTNYLASCPANPDSSNFYHYQSDGTGTPNIDATQYILWAKLERCSSGTVCYWYVCAKGTSSEKLTTAPVSTDCF